MSTASARANMSVLVPLEMVLTRSIWHVKAGLNGMTNLLDCNTCAAMSGDKLAVRGWNTYAGSEELQLMYGAGWHGLRYARKQIRGLYIASYGMSLSSRERAMLTLETSAVSLTRACMPEGLISSTEVSCVIVCKPSQNDILTPMN